MGGGGGGGENTALSIESQAKLRVSVPDKHS